MGFDSRERRTWEACVRSIARNSKLPPPIRPISVQHLGERYKRPTQVKNGRRWDDISQSYCSTDFSLARFWTPCSSIYQWSIFVDGDFLFLGDTQELVDQLDPRYALMCVKHDYWPSSGVKMDNQEQTSYPRKGWSSLMAFNTHHAGTSRLTEWFCNQKSGLWLHSFGWLKDHEIGEITKDWNWLVDCEDKPTEIKGAHFTLGTPELGVESSMDKTWWEYA